MKRIPNEKKEVVKDISLIRVVNQEKIALDTIKNILKHITEKYNITGEDVLNIIYEHKRFLSIPISIFCKELSPLESVVKFLKEVYKQNFSEIAITLNRDQTTIWITYHNSIRKKKEEFKAEEALYWIPISIFKERKLSILELVSEFLKEQYHLSYHEIAVLLKRNDRTIWTVYQRAKKKRQISNQHAK